ncbi:elongation factor 4 [bacterium]|nr:elongation factor 4 [bacterium]|tara:strand:- start:7486 stop:9273 length:1788 start_codon:yes stop_codon:yes gene_type:complete
MDTNTIRNFSIIAHIDHGKSTLADRMLEVTKTISEREMKDQLLDQMELERERGITIKMQPVRMGYQKEGTDYVLNLIDTPGHIDFSYEVSRALKSIEGTILLVDATQGVQAQTLTVLDMAKELNLPIIPVLNKIDLAGAQTEEVKQQVVNVVGCSPDEILCVSAKTGEGVEALLDRIVDKVPSPKKTKANSLQSLIFDFEYSNHQGVIVYTRVYGGEVKKGDELLFVGAKERFIAQEVGVFSPLRTKKDSLKEGEIGYIVTGIKRPGVTQVGDTVTLFKSQSAPVTGFEKPKPVVWASLYPESQDDFDVLRQALGKLLLTDSSLSFEEEASVSLGRGFRCGFLGMLHLEIITERLKREFNLNLIITSPTITYKVFSKGGKEEIIYSPVKFPDHGSYEKVLEPWIKVTLIVPGDYLGNVMTLLYEHEAIVGNTNSFGDNRMALDLEMPLRELMRNFFDEIKSATSGYASLSYEMGDMREAQVTRLDVLIAEEIVPAFSRIIAERRAEEEARDVVEKLHDVLPRQQFVIKIQAQAKGRIIASKTLKALRKDVTAKLYGGDITRKMKLREKQKKGKKKMKEGGKVSIPQDVFLKVMRG